MERHHSRGSDRRSAVHAGRAQCHVEKCVDRRHHPCKKRYARGLAFMAKGEEIGWGKRDQQRCRFLWGTLGCCFAGLRYNGGQGKSIYRRP